eukprot:CAMPEP_0115028384 /NCGR_PEP_ID=MMETSP0216-20121206/36249_1 /TAXON_ID=223996 /ORGANISM="Protocruzia adherens, Strain Boccale" /LENGTH=644 /DNA_ID=CAMNT_0002404519 /DNA_START=38 /DNA_END=1972 /DNA_ORIENTATION=+
MSKRGNFFSRFSCLTCNKKKADGEAYLLENMPNILQCPVCEQNVLESEFEKHKYMCQPMIGSYERELNNQVTTSKTQLPQTTATASRSFNQFKVPRYQFENQRFHVEVEKRRFEAQTIAQLEGSKNQEEFYRLSSDWVKLWRGYIKGAVAPPEIDNSHLVNAKTGTVTRNMEYKKDFEVVNKAVWDFFVNAYKGGPVLKCEGGEKFDRSPIREEMIASTDTHTRGEESKRVGSANFFDTSHAFTIVPRMNSNLSVNRFSLASANRHENTLEEAASKVNLDDEKTLANGLLQSISNVSLKEGNVGLVDSGNFSFALSIIQSLLSVVPWRKHFLERFSDRNLISESQAYLLIKKGTRLSIALHLLFVEVWTKELASTLIPTSMTEIIDQNFTPTNKNDPISFLHFIIESLQDEQKNSQNKVTDFNRNPELVWSDHIQRTKSLIDTTMTGQMTKRIECPSCQEKNYFGSLFHFLTVPIPSGMTQTVRKCIDLKFKHMVKSCKVTECPTCGHDQDLKVSAGISHFPDILVVHLDRKMETYRPENVKSTFVTEYINFQTYGLDLSVVGLESAGGPVLYDLSAIVSCQGSIENNCYMTFGKRKNHWYSFTESEVKQIPEQNVTLCSAYLLFYTRKEGESPHTTSHLTPLM